MLLVCAVYAQSFSFGLTRLDDYVFLVRFRHFNSHWADLATSFGRGVFGWDDNYYRPIFLDSLILNVKLLGGSIMSFHIVNVVLHMVAVALLFPLLIRLRIAQPLAFLLSAVFAVAPVLVQAVSWIPGRNDTLLAIFGFCFLSYSIDYMQSNSLQKLLASLLFLLLALFTKEAGVLLLPVVFVLLFMINVKVIGRKSLILFLGSVCAISFWWLMRSQAHLRVASPGIWATVKQGIYRTPLVLHYFGKFFIPVKLSVFPLLRDTSVIPGCLASIIIAVGLWLNKSRDMRLVAGGLVIFLLLSLPALFLPGYMSVQTFEHRMYLPALGLLLVASQTIYFSPAPGVRGAAVVPILFVLALVVVNFRHQRHFASPRAFWSQAVATAPSSAYARVMLAMQVNDAVQAHQLFRDAWQLNPREKLINYHFAITLQKEDSVAESEKYLLAEKALSNYYLCDLYLARVAIEKGDIAGAAQLFRNYVARDPNRQPQDVKSVESWPYWPQPDSVRALVLRAVGE